MKKPTVLTDEIKKEIAYMWLIERKSVHEIYEKIKEISGKEIKKCTLHHYIYQKLPKAVGKYYRAVSKSPGYKKVTEKDIKEETRKLISLLKEDKKKDEEIKRLKQIIVALDTELKKCRGEKP